MPSEDKNIVVGVGEHKLCSEPDTVLATYALGSCLGISVYHQSKKIGGILHAMMPTSRVGDKTRPAMFVDTGLETLMSEMRAKGLDIQDLEFKVFGGAQVMQADQYFRIGDKNVEAVRKFFEQHKISCSVWEIGGNVNRTIKLHLSTGKVSVRLSGQPEFFV